MIKKIKKVVVCVTAAVTLLGVGTMAVHALPLDSNAHIDLNGVASRPVVGNIRGSGFVETRNANSNGIRVRIQIRSDDSNGNVAGNNNSSWHQRTAASGNTLVSMSQAHVNQHVGSTRRGRVRIQGERRASATGAWGSTLTYDRSWN